MSQESKQTAKDKATLLVVRGLCPSLAMARRVIRQMPGKTGEEIALILKRKKR